MFGRKADGSWAPARHVKLAPLQKIVCLSQSFVSVADYNGDGKPDLLARASFGQGIAVALGPFRDDSPAEVTAQIDFRPRPVDADGVVVDFTAADWDNDGKPDLLVRQALPDGQGGIWWFRNLGGPGLTKLAEGKRLLGEESITGSWGFCVADWNGDGKPDLITTRDETSLWRSTVLVHLRE